MPSFTELRDHVERVLGLSVTGAMSPRSAVEELITRGEMNLAHAVDRELARYDGAREPLRELAPSSPQLILPSRVLGAGQGDPVRIQTPNYMSYYGVDWADRAPLRTAAATRPPAKEPTSRAELGAAEAIDAEYAALVAELGVNSAAVDLEQFKALVPRAGLRVYHRAEVQEFLHCKYGVPVGNLTHHVVWGWRPLRKQDRGVGNAMVALNGQVQRGAETYSKPIPYPVLLTVKVVRDACPSARFYVSDEMQAERILDPFLLVEIGGEQFVIERWDEPAFRAKA